MLKESLKTLSLNSNKVLSLSRLVKNYVILVFTSISGKDKLAKPYRVIGLLYSYPRL